MPIAARPAKQSFLPPKSPFPHAAPRPAAAAQPRERPGHHQRTSSESFLIEEQPSWLDELLDEPETPVRRPVHRRSSSDSFAYRGDPAGAAYYAEPRLQQSKGWEAAFSAGAPAGYPAEREGNGSAEKVGQEEFGKDGSPERNEGSREKQAQSETDTKRVKQQFAQRSRVRKLQYIAELERHVQALQAKGLEVSAELEFIDQQNLILNLENKALKQRLDSVAQTQHIKRLQQEMLEREIARLKLQYQEQQQQQQQQQQPASSHGRRGSRDLDLQFATLSLKHKEPNTARDPVSGPLYI